MSQFDEQYNAIIQEILETGKWDKDQNVRPKWKDGTPAYRKSITGAKMIFNANGEEEVPIVTAKELRHDGVDANHEINWIWVQQSNRVKELRKNKINIWNNWEQPDGTIGKAYGYQLGKKYRMLNGKKVSQVDYLRWQLKHTPASTQMMTTLWVPGDLDEMALVPCVYETHWFVFDKVLEGIIKIRSNDMGLGNPYNIFQYYILQRMLAQECGYRAGKLQFDIDHAHIYERHIEPLQYQLTLPTYKAPKLWVNPEITHFYDFTVNDFRLLNYQHGPTIKMELTAE